MERHQRLDAPTPNKERAKKDVCMVKGVTYQIRRIFMQVLQVVLNIADPLIIIIKYKIQHLYSAIFT